MSILTLLRRCRHHRLLRYGVLALVTILAFCLLLPALLNKETALEIKLASEHGSLPDGFYVYQLLNGRGIKIKSITPARDSLIILLDTPEQALAAQRALKDDLKGDYSILPSDRQTTGHWLHKLNKPSASVS